MVQEGYLVYLYKVEASNSIRTLSVLGSTNHLYYTGLFKALLAAYPQKVALKIIQSTELTKKTPYTLTTLEALQKEFAAIRQRGYAIDDRENKMEVFCVAAPVYDRLGKPIAAISIAGMASRFIGNQERISECGDLVRMMALDLSKRIGYREDSL